MNKYRNRIAQSRDGKSFASIAERDRYEELLLLQKGKQIADLTVQPRFPIRINTFLICTYVGDFMYTEGNQWIVEDVKGHDTPVFRLKRKMFEAYWAHYELRVMRRSVRGFVADTGTRRKATVKRRSGRSSGL